MKFEDRNEDLLVKTRADTVRGVDEDLNRIINSLLGLDLNATNPSMPIYGAQSWNDASVEIIA